jgi:hypothetical protein
MATVAFACGTGSEFDAIAQEPPDILAPNARGMLDEANQGVRDQPPLSKPSSTFRIHFVRPIAFHALLCEQATAP